MTHAISIHRSVHPRLRSTLAAFAVLLLAPSAACTWVPLSEGGETVQIASAAEVAGCKKIGGTSSTVADKIGFIPRGKSRMDEELNALARNKAAKMGGNRVVAIEEPEPGERIYEVYRCDGS